MFTSAPPSPRPVDGGLFGFGPPAPSAATEEYVLPDIFNALGNRKALDSRRALALALLGEPLPPFRRPGARVRIKHELQKDFWTDVEFAAISCGINPSFATLSILTSHPGDKTAFECIRRRDLILRAQIMGALPARIPPGLAISWAVEKKLSLPSGLVERAGASPAVGASFNDTDIRCNHSRGTVQLEACASKPGALIDQAPQDDAATPKPKKDLQRLGGQLTACKTKCEHLLKILGSILVDRYKATTETSKRNVVAKLVAATDRAGVSVGDDTIRSHVNEALALVSKRVPQQLER